MSKLKAGNIHFNAAATSRIESSNDHIAIVAGANKTIMNVTGEGVTHVLTESVTLTPTVNASNIIVGGGLNSGNNITVRGGVNVTGSGTITISGNVRVSGTINAANVLINGQEYHKNGAWVRIAANTITNGANIKIRNIGTQFKHLRLTLLGLVPQTTNTYAIIKFSTDNGATSNSTGYVGYNWRKASSTIALNSNTRTWATSSIELNGAEESFSGFQSNDANLHGLNGEFLIGSFGQAQKTKIYGNHLFPPIAGSSRVDQVHEQHTMGMWNYQVINDAIDIYYSNSSNFSGTIYLDGLLA